MTNTVNQVPAVGRAKEVVFNATSLEFINAVSKEIRNSVGAMGLTSPLFSQFIGSDAVSLTADGRRGKFVVRRAVSAAPEVATQEPVFTEEAIQFSSKTGKQIMTFLVVILPALNKKYAESKEFQDLQSMNLKGRLVSKLKAHEERKKTTVLMSALNMADVYVTVNGKVFGQLIHIEEDDLMDIVFTEKEINGKKELITRKGVEFRAAKDTRPEHLLSKHTLFAQNADSLGVNRFATAKKKKVQTIEVIRTYAASGITSDIREPRKVLMLGELLSIDGNKLPFNENNGRVAKAVFSAITVLHRENGELAIGEDVSGENGTTFSTYMKSVSQSRQSGAIGFTSLDDVIMYFLGTGQDEIAYMKKHKDKEGEETGYNVVSVNKASKRFALGLSDGKKPSKGLLSRFNKSDLKSVKFFKPGERGVRGEIKPAYIELINKRDEKITIAITEDFTSQIQAGNDFLLNKLDEDNAFQGIEKFNHWNNKKAIKELLTRNLTDGAGAHSFKMTNELRAAGVLNSHDAFQLRVSVGVKGASHEHDPLCELFECDFLLTAGMVKAEEIIRDIRNNGFQLFVVGQRKDGADGAWIASQATQQYGMTVDELKGAVGSTFAHTVKAIDNRIAGGLLAIVNAAEEEESNEFDITGYLRLAEEFSGIMDEQYIMDEVVVMAVKKLNKVLDSKFFVERARSRYMFTDPLALLNAATAGRYNVLPEDCVLGAYEVVAPSIKDGKPFMEIGRAKSTRFPITIPHEAPVVNAVAPDAYKPYIEKGLWQGCVFYDAMTWVVAQQAGADHDGDSAILIFDEVVVTAHERMVRDLFAGQQFLPVIDCYVKYDKEGNAIDFEMGCPTYVTELTAKEKTVEEMQIVKGFRVHGYDILTQPGEFNGRKGEKRRREFLEVVAEMNREITVNTIETSFIGMIANYAMILTDLLSRTGEDNGFLLSEEQRNKVQIDLLALCVAGRWEIDRPKHGGAYMEMPMMKELFSNFEVVNFDEVQVKWTKEAKYSYLYEEKGVYANLYQEIVRKGVIQGFRVVKPHWLASQKDENGPVRENSMFQEVLGYSNHLMVALCDKYQKGHSNTAKNNIRAHIKHNMDLDPAKKEIAKYIVTALYTEYSNKEQGRSAAEKMFKAELQAQLQEAGAFGKKNVDVMTKAKINAKLRKHEQVELAKFSNARDILKGEFRKEMYVTAKKLDMDIRTLVGVLYLVINGQKRNDSASFSKDGREYRFRPSNGFISIPFEVFAEEMQALLSGKVSETYFMPFDTSFTLLKTSLLPEGMEITVPAVAPSSNTMKVRVFTPTQSNVNKTVSPNRQIRMAVRHEDINGVVRSVAYFLKNTCQAEDVWAVTREDAIFGGSAPAHFTAGIWSVHVDTITFNEDGTVAHIVFN